MEDRLGIPENNHGGPDFGEYELKSTRANSASMLTLFTKSPEPRGSNSYLLRKFGYLSDRYSHPRKVLHATLSASRPVPISDSGRWLRIHCSQEGLYIESDSGIENVFWTHEVLGDCFNTKYRGKFIYAKAESRGSGESEEFHYVEAYEVSGFNYEAMTRLLLDGKVLVDIRIGQYPDGRTHDHGTAFRIHENHHHLLFKEQRRIV